MTVYDIIIRRHDDGEDVAKVTFRAESPADGQSDDAWMEACAEGFARHVGEVIEVAEAEPAQG